jgi:hypothetical protein
MNPETPDSPVHRGGGYVKRVTYSECQECGAMLQTFAQAAAGVCECCRDDTEEDA